MIEKLEEFSKYFAVAGFKNIKIIDADRFFSDVKKCAGATCIQFFDADSIAGADHLRFAAINALTAFKSKLNISNSVAMETLLYASAQHQIKDSLKLLGISSKSSRVAVLILTETKGKTSAVLDSISELFRGKRDDSVIEFTKEKISRIKKIFGISQMEIEARTEGKLGEKEALTDLVIEHMALLATER
jgi:tRNA threonylcarbamoyladenosine modification (KEOPS) complex Cgi121 subunit